MNLGVAYMRQGERGAPGALERAVAAYEAALTVRTRAANPEGWASTQNNLGLALHAQGARGAPGALERAAAAFDAALTVRTRDANPVGWADTQFNLALVYRAMGRMRDARAAAANALAGAQQVGDAAFVAQAQALLASLPAE